MENFFTAIGRITPLKLPPFLNRGGLGGGGGVGGGEG